MMGGNQPALTKTGKSNQAPGPGGPATQPVQDESLGALPTVQSPITAAPKFVRQAPAAPAFRFGGGPLGGFGQGIAPSPMGMTQQGTFAPQAGMSVAQLAQGYNPFAQQQAAQPQYGGPSPGMKGDEGQLPADVAAARRQAAVAALAQTTAGGGKELKKFKGGRMEEQTHKPTPDQIASGDISPEAVAEWGWDDVSLLHAFGGKHPTSIQAGWSDQELGKYWNMKYGSGPVEIWKPDARVEDRGEDIKRFNDEQQAAASRALADMFGQAYGGNIPQAEYARSFMQLQNHYNTQEAQLLLDETERAQNEFANQESDERAMANAYLHNYLQMMDYLTEEGDIMDQVFYQYASQIVNRFLAQGASAEWINNNVIMKLQGEFADTHYGATPTQVSQGNVTNQGDPEMTQYQVPSKKKKEEKTG